MRVIGVWLAIGVGLAPAAADPGVAWDAPAGCPSANDLRVRVERRIGASAERALHGIEITIAPDPDGFVATVDARGLTVANELRTLRSAHCDELADAIAIVVARLAGEAGAFEARLDRDHGEAPDGAHARARGRQLVDGEWGGGGRVLGVSGIGALPRVNLGGEVAGYVRRKAAFVELALARWVPDGATFEVGAPALRLDVATVRVGWRSREMPLRAWFAGELGRLARADLTAAATRRWTALGAGFGVAWPMAPSARLLGTVEVAVPLERGEITHLMPPSPDPYRPGSAAARCAFGIEIGWP